MTYKIKITTRENELVTKTTQVDDPKTGTKKTLSYQTYEWKDLSTSDVIEIPKNTQSLAILSEIASAAGYNTKQKTLDANIRYIVEVVDSTGSQDSEQLSYWFRSTCGAVVFENQAKTETETKTEYRCPYCQELLAFKTK